MTKRLVDLVVSLLVIVLLSPLLFVVAVLVKLTSRGPVLFTQERVGRGFRPFRVFKFRTMVPDAPRLGGPITFGDDPRVTPVGRFLRRTKLDELPQFLNVVRGEMSVVGPRPEVPRYVEMFRSDYAEILAVRPGITDPASLAYRHESEILGRAADPERTYVTEVLPAKIALAKDYVRHASVGRDLQLIALTGLRMLEGSPPQN